MSTLFTFSQKAEDIDAMVSSLSPSTSLVSEVKVYIYIHTLQPELCLLNKHRYKFKRKLEVGT